jgi:hypothetical protein
VCRRPGCGLASCQVCGRDRRSRPRRVGRGGISPQHCHRRMFLACSSVSVSKKWCYTPEYAQSPCACAGHPRGMKWRVPLLVDLEVRLVAYRAYLRDHGLSSWPRVFWARDATLMRYFTPDPAAAAGSRRLAVPCPASVPTQFVRRSKSLTLERHDRDGEDSPPVFVREISWAAAGVATRFVPKSTAVVLSVTAGPEADTGTREGLSAGVCAELPRTTRPTGSPEPGCGTGARLCLPRSSGGHPSVCRPSFSRPPALEPGTDGTARVFTS